MKNDLLVKADFVFTFKLISFRLIRRWCGSRLPADKTNHVEVNEQNSKEHESRHFKESTEPIPCKASSQVSILSCQRVGTTFP